jgi:hypothetical protein
MTPEEAGQVADLVRERRQHAVDVASWRRILDVPPDAPTALQVRMDRISQENPRAAVGLNLALTLGLSVVAMDRRGEQLTAASRDPETLCGWWDDDSEHRMRWPGVVCGEESGLFALRLNADGWNWLRELATEKVLGRVDRIFARLAPKPVDRVAQLGVPRVADDWSAPEHTTSTVRSHDGQELVLMEVRDLVAEMQTSSRGEQEYRHVFWQNWQLTHQPVRSHRWLVWSYVPGLPVGRPLRAGAAAMTVLPARDSLLDLGEGCVYRVVNFPGHSPWLKPPPDWLVETLSEL